VSFAQQRWPAPPQGSTQVPLWQIRPLVHVLFGGQQGPFVTPQVRQVPLLQITLAPVQGVAPLQQGWPGRPQG
jgi:hypothetical protein